MTYKNKKNFLIFLIIFSVTMLFVNISDGLLDCSTCHTSDPGKSAVKAKDTIEINENTCLKCHNPKYPPTPIGYNTHLVHVGKYSANVNYFARHPEISKSLQCDNCHKLIFDCQNCHAKGIPHVSPPLGNNCKGCHREIDNLFKHPTVNLTIHNIFSFNSTKDCQMCHNPDNMLSFRLASGDIVPIESSHNLCQQCHSSIYDLWINGQHYVNKTLPTDTMFMEDKATQSAFENSWESENTCVNCHNPHNPSELYQLPGPTGKMAGSAPSNIYMFAGIILVLLSIVMVSRYKKVNINSIKIININGFLSKLENISLPKISLPISITVEEVDEKSKLEEVDEKSKLEEVEEKSKLEEVEEKSKLEEVEEKSKADRLKTFKTKYKYSKYRGDILFISGILIMFSLFYIIFGSFLPMSVAISESMSPHIEKGDLIFYSDISRVSNIRTFNEQINTSGYKSFEEYGDVIIYKPFGQKGIPIIHRAMYYINNGEIMPGGLPAQSEGYITKGDNNYDYDQAVDISKNQPVKKEWVIGVARFRIPYAGYIRMLIPW